MLTKKMFVHILGKKNFQFQVWKWTFIYTVSTTENYTIDTVSTDKVYAINKIFTYKN